MLIVIIIISVECMRIHKTRNECRSKSKCVSYPIITTGLERTHMRTRIHTHTQTDTRQEASGEKIQKDLIIVVEIGLATSLYSFYQLLHTVIIIFSFLRLHGFSVLCSMHMSLRLSLFFLSLILLLILNFFRRFLFVSISIFCLA